MPQASESEPAVEKQTPGLVRETVYDTSGEKETGPKADVEKIAGLERSGVPDTPEQSHVDDQGPVTKPAAEASAGIAAEAGEVTPADSRPFPGSATGGVARRERRITVSDFQPASRNEEPESFENKIPADEENESTDKGQILSTPSMAPSERLIKKKRGFLKRLFGIK
jgi:hypothetical protein